MTVQQFVLVNNDTDTAVAAVATDGDTVAVTGLDDTRDQEFFTELQEAFTNKLAQLAESPFADEPPTEILRYNLYYLTSQDEEYPDFEAAAAGAQDQATKALQVQDDQAESEDTP